VLEFIELLSSEERTLMKFLLLNANAYLNSKREPTALDRDVMGFSGDIAHAIRKIEIQKTGSLINKKESK
jgi:hypothetical protein